MKFGFRAAARLALFCLLTVPLLGSTKIAHRWVLADSPIPRFRKLLVAGMVEDYVVRQEFEDLMKKLLANYGVEGVQSYLILPPKNEMMESELRERMKESSLDGVLVIRPKGVSSESEEFVGGGIYVPPKDYYTFWPYWNMSYDSANSNITENIPVKVEFNLYSTSNERLIWSGETDTIYLGGFEKMRKQYAVALVNRLKKDKIISKK